MRLRAVAFLVGTVALILIGEFALSHATSSSAVIDTEGSLSASISGLASPVVSVQQAATPVPPPTQTPEPPPTATPVPPTPTATPRGPAKVGAADPPWVTSESAVIVDGRSGQVLYDKNGDVELPPASTTKIITAIVALDHGNPKDQVTAEFDASELIDSTLMGLYVGDTLTLEDLLYGLMLPSGNDAALAIANHIAGSKPAFVEMMNTKARELGLHHSHFMNPHGLDEDGHYSSARDLVAFARYGMTKYPLFVELSRAKYWEVGGSRPHEVYNLNKLLWEYPGADGVKIGYTDLALKTIVASATRDGHQVFVGLMRSQDLWTDSSALFDYAFENFAWPSN